MQIKSQTYVALGIATIGLTLVGCGLGEPSNAQIESSLRQLLFTELKEDGAPSGYMENLQKNLKVTVLKNNGCKPAEEKAYDCDVTVELDVPGYQAGNGLPNVEAQKKSVDLKARYYVTPSGWEARENSSK